MNDIEHTITFTFSTTKGIMVEAKWVIMIKNSNSPNGKIESFLYIKDAPCKIEKRTHDWFVSLSVNNNSRTRKYLKTLAFAYFRNKDIAFPISEAEKNYIESILMNFINPFMERIQMLNKTSEGINPE